MNNQDMLQFLLDLDRSDVTCSTWEASFIESVLQRGQVTFSPKQKDVIVKLAEKYDRDLR